MASTMFDQTCDRLRNPDFASTILAILILIGLVVSYLPQHYRIISRGTSEGISPYFVLLGTVSATASFANLLTLPQTSQDVGCCQELSTYDCVAGILGVAQLGFQWISFFFIFILFLVFFRYTDATLPEEELATAPPSPRWSIAVLVGSAVVLHMLLVIIISILFIWIYPTHIRAWANFLGICSAICAAIQYIPQIWTTYHLKHVGSLSVPMMLIQTPGGFLFALSLALRLGWQGWSAWGILVLSASMQGILLVMALYYAAIAREAEEASKPPPLPRTYSRVYENGMDENTPGPYSGHPGMYADNPDEEADIIERQDLDARDDTRPLLRTKGGRAPRRRYDGQDESED